MTLQDILLQDPYVLVDQSTQTYLLYVGDPSSGVMVYQSGDLINWSGPTQVYFVPSGGWAAENQGASAPEVHYFGGKYYLFSTLRNSGTVIAAAQRAPGPGNYLGTSIWQHQTALATSIASANSPLGPFVDLNKTAPLTAPALMIVDGTLHVDPDGTPWMVFAQSWIQKPDANMAAVQLTPDLAAPAAEPIWMFKASDAPWYLDPVYGAFPGRSIVNDLQDLPCAAFAPQLYRTPNGSLIALWSSYRRHFTEYVQTQAISKTGNIAGPWKQLDPIVTDQRGHGMIFESLDGQLLLILHNNKNNPADSRAEIYDVAITDNGVVVSGHRSDLDGTAI